jgi:WD40 repeat protein/tetratricopeptide (TPR) repeat protein
VTALTAAAAFVLISLSRNDALDLADKNGQLADANGRLADTNGALAKRNGELLREQTKLTGEKEAEADRARKESRQARRQATMLAYQQASTLCEQGKVDQGMLALANGLALAQEAEAPDLERLFRLNLAAWRRRLHTQRAVLPHAAGVSAVAFSPRGKTVATACWDHTTRLRNAGSGEPLGEPVKHDDWVTALEFSADGNSLLIVGGFVAEVWDVAEGKRLAVLDHKPVQVTSAAFGPAGRTVLTGALDGKARLWDVATRNLVGEPLAWNDWISAVAFRPDGRAFVTAGKNGGGVQVWDAADRRPLVSFQHPGGVAAVAFRPDGKTLLTGGGDGTARLWDAENGRPLGSPLSHPQAVTSVAFSPDGSLVLTGCLDRAARVWDAATGEVVGQPLTHSGEVLAVAFGPDGRTLLTGQGRTEGDARLWDLAPGELLGGPMAHSRSVLTVAVSPDSRRVATAGRDNTARLWDAQTAEPIGEALRHQGEVNALAFSPNSQILVTGGDDSYSQFWHAADGKPVLREGRATVGEKKVLFQQRIGGPERPGGLLEPWRDQPLGKQDWGRQPVWGPARGKLSGTNFYDQKAVYALSFSPEGRKLAQGGRGGAALYDMEDRGPFPILSLPLEVRDGQPLTHFGPPKAVPPVYAVAFSADGRQVATATADGMVRVWDATKFDPSGYLDKVKEIKDPKEFLRLDDEFRTPKLVAGPFRHEGEVVALAFSPDGRTLLAGGADKAARLWDLSTGEARVLRHQGPVVALAFRSDGRECVTGSWDGTARLWDPATGEQIGQPLAHLGKVLAVAFSADGSLVLTGGENHNARLWDAATGKPVGPPLRQRDEVRAVAFRPDGGAVVTAGDDGAALLWATPAPAEGGADRMRLWVEAWTGQARDPDGAVRFLEPAGWQEGRKALAGVEPPIPAADDLARCRQQAGEAEATGRWYAARWNLDRLVKADPRNVSCRLRRAAAAEKLGDLVAAWEDCDAAVSLAPDEWQPRFQRGRLAVLSRKWRQGIDDLSDALERLPSEGNRLDLPGPDGRSVSIRFGRGFARAALGQWKEAAADFEIFQNPFTETTAEMWIDEAVVLLKVPDAKRAGVVCQGMLTKFANPQDKPTSTVMTTEYGRQEVHTYGRPFNPRQAAAMAWACSLSPDAPPDRNRPLELAREAAEALPKDYPCARALGAALHRAEKGEEAVRQLEAAAALQKSSPSTWLFLAMAHQKCGRPDKAKEQLDKARAWIEQARKPKPEGAADRSEPSWDDLPWTEQAALELLQGEAEKLIAKDPAKP